MPSVRIRPKAAVFLAVGALLLGLAALFNWPALALVGFLPVLLVVLHARPAKVENFHATRVVEDAERVREGDPLPVSVEVRTDARRLQLIELLDHLPPVTKVTGGSNYQVVGLRRAAPFPWKYTAEFPLFGIRDVGPLDLRVEDPFGFFGTQWTILQPKSIEVDPNPATLDATEVRSKVPQVFLGLYEVSQPGSGFDFFGLRNYTSSDRMRDVNWKATSRVQRLIVNQHVKDSRATVLLLLDARATETTGPLVHSPWAENGRILTEIALALAHRRDSMRLVTYGSSLNEPAWSGPGRQLEGIRQTLLTSTPEGGLPLGHVVERLLPTLELGSPVVLLSSLLQDPTVVEAAAQLRMRNHPLLVFTPRLNATASELDPVGDLVLRARHSVEEQLRQYGATVEAVPIPEAA